ncbi:hypothetical protein [Halovenus salina]|uniref:Uncharacterized protein n=1 Tax=Halovenus salina TaxID=1510225 RepID=A0ABD5W5T8_9EURY
MLPVCDVAGRNGDTRSPFDAGCVGGGERVTLRRHAGSRDAREREFVIDRPELGCDGEGRRAGRLSIRPKCDVGVCRVATNADGQIRVGRSPCRLGHWDDRTLVGDGVGFECCCQHSRRGDSVAGRASDESDEVGLPKSGGDITRHRGGPVGTAGRGHL